MSGDVRVTTTDGVELSVAVAPGETLMEALQGRDLVLGTCGGACACGTCHVYVETGGEALAPPSEDETDMLEALADLVEIRPTSRLSCQIKADETSGSLAVTIAPHF